MCGRFSITGDLDFYAEYFGVDDVAAQPLAPNWNVAPTDPVYVIAERDGKRILDTMRWGLVPYYAKDDKKIHINARLETVDTSAAFRESFARRRCLIPADGFYEWEPAERGSITALGLSGRRVPDDLRRDLVDAEAGRSLGSVMFDHHHLGSRCDP